MACSRKHGWQLVAVWMAEWEAASAMTSSQGFPQLLLCCIYRVCQSGVVLTSVLGLLLLRAHSRTCDTCLAVDFLLLNGKSALLCAHPMLLKADLTKLSVA